jgi:serine/alanine adding enzyme
MKIVNTLSEANWRNFIDDHPKSNIFHTPEMFNVFGEAEGYRPSIWVAQGQDGLPLAMLLPVQISVLEGQLSSLTTRAVVYGSVICQQTDQGIDALTPLLEAYRRDVGGRPLFTELRNVSDMGSLQTILEANKYHFHDQLNYLVDLQRPPNKIWEAMEGQARTKIRKAMNSGLEIEEVASPDKQELAYEIISQVYRRIQVPLGSRSLFEAAYKILRPKNMLKIFLARKDDAYLGASFNLLYKNVIFGWYAGSLGKEYSKLGVNELLNWHIIEWGAGHGYHIFDFGGAGSPNINYGPRNFKSKFNGTLVNYGRNTLVHSPLRLGLSTMAYKLYRKLL